MVHEAETAQLPQSTRPVLLTEMQLGWDCGKAADGVMLATLRAYYGEEPVVDPGMLPVRDVEEWEVPCPSQA